MSKPLFISSALLVLSMVWGLYDEVYGIRPWKGYQARFVKLYSRYLKTAAGGEADVETQIKASSEYKQLDAEMQAAEKAAMPGASAIDKKINQELVPKILALNDPFQEVRSHIGSLTYQIEVSQSESSKNSLRKEIEELRAEKHDVAAAGRSAEAQHGLQGHERPAAGLEGREGQAAARARGLDEAGHRAAHASATNTCPTGSRRPAPRPSRRCRTRSTSSISAYARFT